MTNSITQAYRCQDANAFWGSYRKDIRMQAALSYMQQHHIERIEEITDEEIFRYRLWVCAVYPEGGKQGMLLPGLEIMRNRYYREETEKLLAEAGIQGGEPMARRAAAYMAAHGIRSLQEADYDLRESLKRYLKGIGMVHSAEVLARMDMMKLLSVKRREETVGFLSSETPVMGEKIYLPYYPRYQAASCFFQIRHTECMLFDFSLPASDLIKSQIRPMLEHLMNGRGYEKPETFRISLISLWILYDTALKEGWDDLEMLMCVDEAVFKEKLMSYAKSVAAIGFSILDKTRRYLFLSSETIHWHATVWYIDRFHLASHRVNAANPIYRFFFTDIADTDKREALQMFMKYQVGVTDRSVTHMKSSLRYLKHFLLFLSQKGKGLGDLDAILFDEFLHDTETARAKSADTANIVIREVALFYEYLSGAGYVRPLTFDPFVFRKKKYPAHHDRRVPDDILEISLANLKYLPMQLRLMYLHLYALGLRINEVCTIQAGNYFWRDGVGWLRIYQNKMRREKEVPLPAILYELMKAYIGDKELSGEEYVFTKDRKPMSTNTFRLQMKKWCAACGLDKDGYRFRTHDFRHTVATRLHEEGQDITLIREYLGHKETDMTRQYIDEVPKEILKKSREYFKAHTLWEDKDGGHSIHA